MFGLWWDSKHFHLIGDFSVKIHFPRQSCQPSWEIHKLFVRMISMGSITCDLTLKVFICDKHCQPWWPSLKASGSQFGFCFYRWRIFAEIFCFPAASIRWASVFITQSSSSGAEPAAAAAMVSDTNRLLISSVSSSTSCLVLLEISPWICVCPQLLWSKVSLSGLLDPVCVRCLCVCVFPPDGAVGPLTHSRCPRLPLMWHAA